MSRGSRNKATFDFYERKLSPDGYGGQAYDTELALAGYAALLWPLSTSNASLRRTEFGLSDAAQLFHLSGAYETEICSGLLAVSATGTYLVRAVNHVKGKLCINVATACILEKMEDV